LSGGGKTSEKKRENKTMMTMMINGIELVMVLAAVAAFIGHNSSGAAPGAECEA